MRWFSLLSAIALTGCSTPIEAPTASASLLSTDSIYPGNTVELDASGSSDPNDLDLEYRWEFVDAPAGANVAFNDDGLVSPSFVPDVSGTYAVDLTVSNGWLTSRTADSLQINVTPCADAALTVATITANPDVGSPGTTVELSSTVDGDQTCLAENVLTYDWSFEQLPPGSMAALNDASILNPSFSADVPGLYVVQLVVSDVLGRSSAPGQVEVQIDDCGVGVPVVEDIVTSPTTPNTGDRIQLVPTVSDADLVSPCSLDQELFYSWDFASLPNASRATMNNDAIERPWFTADVPGTYMPRLVVTDESGRVSPAYTFSVTVDACGNNAPIVQAVTPSNALPAPGEAVELVPTVTDDDIDSCGLVQSIAYRWDLVSIPGGSTAAYNDTTLQNPTLVPDVPGVYVAKLVATDSTGRASDPFLFPITASDCGTRAPEVTIDDPGASDVNEAVQLTATVTDLDNDPTGCDLAETFAYRWAIRAQPMGSTASLNNTAASNPTLVPDEPGLYSLRLVVTDSNGQWSDDWFDLVIGDCGAAVPQVTIDNPGTYGVGMDVPLTATVVDTDNDPTGCDLGQGFNYNWSIVGQPTGSTARLNNASSSNPSLNPDASGVYTLRLRVVDEEGLSSTDDFDLVITACGDNAPVAVIDDPGPVDVGDDVVLTAAVSDDDNGNVLPACDLQQTATYAWSIVGQPAASRASLNNPGSANPTLTPDAQGIYSLRLRVTDSTGRVGEGWFDLLVGACGTAAPAVVIDDPGAMDVDDDILLTATVTDLDNDPAGCDLMQAFSYEWFIAAQPVGSAARLNNTGSQTPTLTPDVSGTYSLYLEVTDTAGLVGLDWFDLTVGACGEHDPAVAIDDPGAARVAEDVVLTATVSDDDNGNVLPGCDLGQTFSYAWDVVAQPPASGARLNNPASANPTLTPDVSGIYRLTLTVTDSSGRGTDATAFDLFVDTCGEAAPVVSIVDPGGPFDVQDDIALSAVVTDADDTCAGIDATKSYVWRLLGAPVGSSAALFNPLTATPTLRPDLDGSYTVGVQVSDSFGLLGSDTFTIAAVGACGIYSPQITDITPNTFDTLAWVELGATVVDLDNDAACGCAAPPCQDLFYQWSVIDQPLGAATLFDDDTAPTPGFIAAVAGAYTLQVTVTDDTGRTDVHTETVMAGDCGNNTPVAQVELAAPYSAGPGDPIASPNPVPPGTGVILRGDASFDDDDTVCAVPRNDDLTYRWRLTRLPPGSKAALTGADTAEASFVPDEPGAYEVELVVSDGAHTSDPAVFTMNADLSEQIGPPVGGSVSFLAGGTGAGLDMPAGVLSVGTDIYVVNEGSDSVVHIDSAAGNSVSLLTAGVFLDAPRRITYDRNGGMLYVLNGGDDFVIQVDPATGAQVRFIGATPLAEDIDAVVTGGNGYVAVIGRFRDQIDFYDISAGPMQTNVGTVDFGGNLNDGYAVEVYDVAGTLSIWAPSLEIGFTGGARFRHQDGLGNDIYLDDDFSSLFFEDLSYEPVGDWVYVGVGGQSNFIQRVDNCLGSPCAAEVYASGFDDIGGIYAEDDDVVLATDRGSNAVYRISVP